MTFGDPGFKYGVDFCAYHTVTPTGAICGVKPFPTAQGRSLWGQLSPIDALWMTAALELAKAVTDAIPGQGEDGPQGEIDDFAPCLWNPVPIAVDGYAYKVQAYWSEADQRCWTPPAPSSGPTSRLPEHCRHLVA